MKLPVITLLTAVLLLTGCASPKMVADPMEGYDSLGTLEHKLSTKHCIFVRILTFGLLRNHSYEYMTKRMNRLLSKEARKKYGADAVNNVEYWPLPDSDADIDYIYGRGEMIRYKKFSKP